MLDSISKLGGATEKFSNLAGVLNAAKSAVFAKPEDVCEEPAEVEFKFSRPTSRKAVNHDEVKVEDTYAEDIFFDEDTDDQPLFDSNSDNDDLLAEWEVQGVDEPDTDEELELTEAHKPPLLLGFDTQNYFVELEYMVVADPETGESVAPLVSVKASEDNKSGEIYLNGKLVACVQGAQNMPAEDVVLIKVDA
jgi:hypothetical protein